MKIKSYKLFLERGEITDFLKNDEADLRYIWEDIEDFLNPDFNKGDVKFIFSDIETIRNKLEIPKLYVNFLLKENTGIDMSKLQRNPELPPYDGELISMQRGQLYTSPQSFDILKNHPCYNDLMIAHKQTLSMIGEKNAQLLLIKASNDPWTSDTESPDAIYCEIHYELVNNYLDYIYKKLKYGDSYNFAGNYLKILKGKVEDNNEIMKMLYKLENKRKISSEFSEIYRELYSFGFQYDHIINKAKKLDLSKYINSDISSSEIFFVMCMTGNFNDIEYLKDWNIDFFFYSGSNKGKNLGLEVLKPAFKKCMNSELLWVEDPEEVMDLALLFLIFEPKLLKTNIDRGTDRDYWLEIINRPFNHVAENLIAYNRKESMEWLINLLTSENDGDLSRFIDDIKLHIYRIKSDFANKNLVKNKKMESPDFDFFQSKLIELGNEN